MVLGLLAFGLQLFLRLYSVCQKIVILQSNCCASEVVGRRGRHAALTDFHLYSQVILHALLLIFRSLFVNPIADMVGQSKPSNLFSELYCSFFRLIVALRTWKGNYCFSDNLFLVHFISTYFRLYFQSITCLLSVCSQDFLN